LIVCHCQGVSDRRIRKAVRQGARNCKEVARACRAGGRCGGCRPAIHEIIAAEANDDVLFVGVEPSVAAS
jgi:bacterioferritin-associated ferredoxin